MTDWEMSGAEFDSIFGASVTNYAAYILRGFLVPQSSSILIWLYR